MPGGVLSAFVVKIYFIQHCQQAFTVAGFLKHKLNLAIPRMYISSYAANKKQSSFQKHPIQNYLRHSGHGEIKSAMKPTPQYIMLLTTAA